jgi:hypothetical protein
VSAEMSDATLLASDSSEAPLLAHTQTHTQTDRGTQTQTQTQTQTHRHTDTQTQTQTRSISGACNLPLPIAAHATIRSCRISCAITDSIHPHTSAYIRIRHTQSGHALSQACGGEGEKEGKKEEGGMEGWREGMRERGRESLNRALTTP